MTFGASFPPVDLTRALSPREDAGESRGSEFSQALGSQMAASSRAARKASAASGPPKPRKSGVPPRVQPVSSTGESRDSSDADADDRERALSLYDVQRYAAEMRICASEESGPSY